MIWENLVKQLFWYTRLKSSKCTSLALPQPLPDSPQKALHLYFTPVPANPRITRGRNNTRQLKSAQGRFKFYNRSLQTRERRWGEEGGGVASRGGYQFSFSLIVEMLFPFMPTMSDTNAPETRFKRSCLLFGAWASVGGRGGEGHKNVPLCCSAS